jgi:hypothetical protein
MVLTWRTPGRVEVGAAALDSTAAAYECCSWLLALGIRRRHDLHGAAACGEALRLLAAWKPGRRPRIGGLGAGGAALASRRHGLVVAVGGDATSAAYFGFSGRQLSHSARLVATRSFGRGPFSSRLGF